MRERIDDGARVIQMSRRGVCVLENQTFKTNHGQLTQAPIFENPKLSFRMKKILEGIE